MPFQAMLSQGGKIPRDIVIRKKLVHLKNVEMSKQLVSESDS